MPLDSQNGADRNEYGMYMFQDQCKRDDMASLEEEKRAPASARFQNTKNHSFEPESSEEEHAQMAQISNEIEIVVKKVKRHG